MCDVSHASALSTAQILSLAKTNAPILATHSNFNAILPHTRNLSDEQALSIYKSGGLIGLSVVSEHLAAKDAQISDFIRHLRHAYDLGIAECVCLGSDFDGTVNMPSGITNQASLLDLANALRKADFTTKQIDALFWSNAQRFFEDYFS